MRRLMSGAMVLAAAFALGPLQVVAQQGQRGGAGAPGQQARPMRGAMGRMAGGGVEGIMRMRERLKLTDSQFKQLDGIRAEIVQQRIRHQSTAAELRSRVMAGEATRGTLVDSMTAWRKAGAEARQQDRQRIESVLTDAQKDTLQKLVQRRRAFAGGRGGAMRGMRQRMGGGRGGFMRGRGPGFGGARGWGGGVMPQRMRGQGGGGMMRRGGFGPLPVRPDSGNAGGGS